MPLTAASGAADRAAGYIVVFAGFIYSQRKAESNARDIQEKRFKSDN